MAAADLHNDHNVIVYNIKSKKQLFSVEGSKEKIIDIAWSRKVDDLRFCTVGLKDIKFWYPADASKRLFSRGIFGTKFNQTSFNTVVCDTEGFTYTGGVSGLVHVWDVSGQLEKTVDGPNAEITALAHENDKLIVGCRDSKLLIFKATGGVCTLEKVINLESSYPRSIDYFNDKILVGLRNGNIQEINESTEESKLLMACHCDGETWGIEINPEANSIYTLGDDNKIMEFNFEERKFIKKGVIS